MNRPIYISVSNDFITDQRVQKVAGSLSSMGEKVEVIGRKLSGSEELPARKYTVVRMRLLFKKGFFFYACFNVRLFLFLISRRYIKALVSNDLDTLPANFLVSRLRNKPLIYDSHEYFTEVPELANRTVVKNTWLFIERMILPKLKHACTVNDSLAEIYHTKYHNDFEVIRNLPQKESSTENYELPGWLSGKKILIYQGAVNLDRGIETVIDAVKEMDGVVFIIAGTGDRFHEIEHQIKREQLNHRVYLTGRLRPEQLRSVTKKAHLGVSLEMNTNLNYYYALPNKLFDYMQAGIPTLVSGFPEMRSIVEKYGTGLVVDPSDTPEIKRLIGFMLNDGPRRQEWAINIRRAAEELTWENEQKKLFNLYKRAGAIG